METAQRLIATRRGTILLSVIAAAVAGGLILVYVSRYRDSVRASGQPVTVLVAAGAGIAKGTAGNVIATKRLYSAQTLRQSQVLDGAFSDPSSLRGKVATQDIPYGAQLTSSDFASASTNLASTLTGDQRIVSIPFSSAQGLSGDLQVGDRVDVYAGFNVSQVGPNGLAAGGGGRPIIRRILTNVPVVGVGGNTSGTFAASSANLSFRVSDQQAADLAFASQNGTLWLSLRPSTGAKTSPPNIVSMETLLLGIPAHTVLHSLGGRR
jgi:Flp pilus assembly protein CpaB